MEKQFLISTNPAKNYQEIGRIEFSSAEQVKAAVDAARAAQKDWAAIGVHERIKFFAKLRELVKANLDQIAQLQSQEMGKPIMESIGECKGVLHWLKLHTQMAPQILEPQSLDRDEQSESLLYLEPFGVAAVIAPWNYPIYQFFVNTGPALLAGNTVVLKHSEECPLTAAKLIDLTKQAGFPAGVISCVYGDGSVGEKLINQDINLISFTGSSKVGRQIYELAGKRLIPTILEMGGSSPGIIFEDADLNFTCDSVVNERFRNCGQICCALKRLIVHESIFDRVVSQLKAILEEKIIGDPLDSKTQIGPLVAKRQVDLLEQQLKQARLEGAEVVTGGKRVEKLQGAFFEPTLVINITEENRLWREEVFGPILPVMKFKDESQAIEMANNTPYGLSAFVYTKDAARGMRVAAALEAGQVSINGASYFTEHAPFGGYKASGIGRVDGAIGYRGVTQMKVIARPLTA